MQKTAQSLTCPSPLATRLLPLATRLLPLATFNFQIKEVPKCFEDSVEAEDVERDAVGDRAGAEWAVWEAPKPPGPADTVCALTAGIASPTKRASRAIRSNAPSAGLR